MQALKHEDKDNETLFKLKTASTKVTGICWSHWLTTVVINV